MPAARLLPRLVLGVSLFVAPHLTAQPPQPPQAPQAPSAYLGLTARVAPTLSAGLTAARSGWDAGGVALQAGLPLGRHWAGEVEVSQLAPKVQPGSPSCPLRVTGGCDLTAMTIAPRLLRTPWSAGRSALVVGGGPSFLRLAGAQAGTYLGATALAGARVSVADRWTARADLLGSWYPQGRGGRQQSQWEMQIGMQWHRQAECRDAALPLPTSPTTLAIGATLAIPATASRCRGAAEPMTVTSDHPAIVSIVGNVATAHAIGDATVRLRGARSGREGVVQVHVTAAPVATTVPSTALPTPTVTPDGDRVVATVALAPVYFAFDQSKLTPEGQRVARRWADSLSRITGPGKVLVVGHTDHRGPSGYNRRLGYARAEAVAQALTQGGLSRARLYIISAGELEPAAPPGTDTADAKNRRVEVRRVPPG